MLLQEMQHRIANSLQIIASIILMKARAVQSEETRLHLRDAHSRVMSIAAVQEHLHASGASGPVEVTPYLSKLCETLATSMIGDSRPISLKVCADGGSASSRQAECLGLIVTEKALAHQLGAQVETLAGSKGTSVSVTRATFSTKTRAA